MTIELTYNQLKAPKQTRSGALMEKLSDLYFSNPAAQFAIDLAVFVTGCAVIAALVFVAAA